MSAGQISSHALQVVHAHSSSGVILSNTLSDVTVSSPSTPTVGEIGGVAVAAATAPSLRTISRGSSGLPVVFAGHTDVQRPQIVHASVSRSCFHVKSAMTAAPTVSMSVASMRFGISRMAPFGRSRGERARFTGVVIMCRNFVTGRITRNPTNAAKWRYHIA